MESASNSMKNLTPLPGPRFILPCSKRVRHAPCGWSLTLERAGLVARISPAPAGPSKSDVQQGHHPDVGYLPGLPASLDPRRRHRAVRLACSAFSPPWRAKMWLAYPPCGRINASRGTLFAVQVAAMAMITTGTTSMPENEDGWRTLLLALTPDWPDGEAWSLVVDEWERPALLQPAIVRAADRADYRGALATPDALDMLVTSRNHDVKAERMHGAADEDWFLALLTLQTTEGFLGSGNYGISRMNGGFASRMTFGLRPQGGMAAAWRRDVTRLLEDATDRPDRRGGLPLLWLPPWDGTVQLGFGEMDELYIDICRRIRLRRTKDGGLEALAAGSKVARVAAKALAGKNWRSLGAAQGRWQRQRDTDRERPRLSPDHPPAAPQGYGSAPSCHTCEQRPRAGHGARRSRPGAWPGQDGGPAPPHPALLPHSPVRDEARGVPRSPGRGGGRTNGGCGRGRAAPASSATRAVPGRPGQGASRS